MAEAQGDDVTTSMPQTGQVQKGNKISLSFIFSSELSRHLSQRSCCNDNNNNNNNNNNNIKTH